MPRNDEAPPEAADAHAQPMAFSRLVTSMGALWEAQQRLRSAREPLPGPNASIGLAWATLCEPRHLAASVLASKKIPSSAWGARRSFVVEAPLDSLLAPAFSDDDLLALSRGLEQAAFDIDAAAGSSGFESGSRSLSTLLAMRSPSGNLAYPLLGIGLKPSFLVVGGARQPTLTGHKLASWGDMRFDDDNRLRDQVGWLAGAGNDLLHTMGASLAASLAVEASTSSVGEFPRQRFSAFGASGEVAGRALISHNSELPSALKMSAAAETLAGIESRLRHASAWSSLYALPFTAAATRERMPSSMWWFSSTEFSDALLLSSLAGIGDPSDLGARHSSAKGLRQTALGQALSFLHLSEAPPNKFLGTTAWAKALSEAKANRRARLPAGALGAEPPDGPEHGHSQPHLMTRASMSWISNATAPGQSDTPAVGDAALDIAKASVCGVNFAKHGTGLDGLSAFLAQSDARIGLLQWAAHAHDMHEAWASPGQDSTERSTSRSARVKSWSPAMVRAKRAVDSVAAAMARANARSLSLSLDEARKTEAAWLSDIGFEDAWDQAQSAGALTPAQLAWAKANPMGKAFSSANPMARLAAACARHFGLRPALPEEELAAGLRSALGELGADAPGLDILAASPSLQLTIKELVSSAASGRGDAQGALGFACHALSASASAGLSAAQASYFVKAHLSQGLADAAELFGAPLHGVGRPAFDGFFPGLTDFVMGWEAIGLAALDLVDAKRHQYPLMIAAMARDWAESSSLSESLGCSPEDSQEICASRAREMGARFPQHAQFDWRQRPFSTMSAWEVFDMPSPRLSAAIASAASQKGHIGPWCARAARHLGVSDAVDGNDLIAKTREAVKAELLISDGAWRIAIKSRESLADIARVLEVPAAGSEASLDMSVVNIHASLVLPALLTQALCDPDPQFSVNPKASLGAALRSAASNNIAPASFRAVSEILCQHLGDNTGHGFEELFSDNINPAIADSVEGARFALAEFSAKASRQSKIFHEACKRFEKLSADALRPLPDGQERLIPDLLLRQEAQDLCDWIGGSEHGIWQAMPESPSWGQLSRLSMAWHRERAAAEAARADLQTAARELRAGQASVFSDQSGSGWQPIIGKLARDCWEAHELANAEALAEEGLAQSHCVSNYAAACRQGSTRIFSIRLNGQRKCTLQISPSQNLGAMDPSATFSIVQNRGKYNASVTSAPTLDFCSAVLASVAEAWPSVVQKHHDRLAQMKKAANDKRKAERENLGKAPSAPLSTGVGPP